MHHTNKIISAVLLLLAVLVVFAFPFWRADDRAREMSGPEPEAIVDNQQGFNLWAFDSFNTAKTSHEITNLSQGLMLWLILIALCVLIYKHK